MRRRDLLSDVRYVIDVDTRSNRSRTRVDFDTAVSGVATFVDLAVVAVESLSLNGRPLPSSAWRDGRLELPPLEPSNRLEVTATFAAADDRGLVSFTDVDGERFVYTYGRTDGVVRWAPCFLDVPAMWDLRVQVPDDWVVLSHGSPVARAPGEWRFLPPYPLPDGPTFVAGPFACIEGPDGVPVWSRPSTTEIVQRSPVGAMAAAAIAHHERVLDVPYPYETRDCIFIPGYGSQAGCSGGLVLLHERVLHASVTEEWERYVQWVLAHEIAHSWFGGLAGFDGVDHRWTAEGIATYLCHRANDSWPRFHVLEELEAHRDDQAGSDVPSLIYAKPAAVVRHLESIIGIEAVEAGLTSWLRRYAGGSSTGPDLVAEWAAVSGVDLGEWARDWLYTPGVNTLAFDRNTSTIRQDGSPTRSHHLTIQLFDQDGSPQGSIEVTVTDESTVVTTPEAKEAALVVLNAPNRTYARVRLDEQSLATLPSCMGSLPDDARAACWVSALEMRGDGLMPDAALQALVESYAAAEPDAQVRELLTAAIAQN